MFLSKLSHFIACFLSSEKPNLRKKAFYCEKEERDAKNPLQVSAQECTKVGFQGGQNTNIVAERMKMGFLLLRVDLVKTGIIQIE